MTTGEHHGKVCTQCGCKALEEGFVEDTGQGTKGFTNWIAGPLQQGPFGGARRMGRQRRAIAAFRCTECGHLELFVKMS